MPVVQLIDPEDAVQARWLRNFQGNILKPHGRDHVRCLFFRFTGDPAANRQGLTALADYVTSALQQYEEGQARRDHGLPGPPFGHLALSASGYRALGFSQQLDALANGAATLGAWEPFRRGLRAYGGPALGDPAPDAWNQEYRTGRIDGLMLLADHHLGRLDQRVGQVTRTLNGFATVRRTETGRLLRNAAGKPIEHFGFLDGISQPVFLQSDLPAAIDQWDPRAGPDLVRVADPFTAVANTFGSFLVYRKLEQRVRDFVQRLQQLADLLDAPARGDRELAAALVCGRFRDGTPVTRSGQPRADDPPLNNFSYGLADPGSRCPYQAHIRKLNPRGDDDRVQGNQPGLEPGRRIVRRGFPYGPRARPPTDWSSPQTLPNSGLGLLFMCYQANIAEQFAHLQRAWANRQSFPRAAVGRDPLIGQVGGADGARLDQLWPPSWGAPRDDTTGFRFDFGNFTTLKGGEFFFVPSLPFLRAPTVA
jgi:Dyp-type peroxidase family